MSAITDEERREVLSLKDQGLSERRIAKAIGRAPSTVHEILAAPAPETVNGNGHSEATPGQQTIDGGEVQPGPEPVEEVRVDGTVQLGMFDAGGKKAQSATVTLSGGQFELADGQAFRKGDRLFFAGQAQVFDVGVRDKLDTKTMIPTTAAQRHTARIFELHTGDEEQILIGLFRQLVAANRQQAIELADAFVVEANGGRGRVVG